MAFKIPEAGESGLDVTVVMVSYNGKEKVTNCLQSVFKETRHVSFEVIVSDNGSKDGCVEVIRKRFSPVRVLENKANLGFAAANNRAFSRCSGRYILLLNPDTLLQSDAIGRMVAFMDENPEIGLCGPRLLNADGSLQYSARNFPGVLNQLAESILLNKVFPRSERLGELILNPGFYSFDNNSSRSIKTGKSIKTGISVKTNKSIKSGKGTKTSNNMKTGKKGKTDNRRHARYVDWVTGAALMIRRDALNDIGPLDERYFMYSEEKDWCLGAHRRGWPVVFYPGAEIIHLHGDSGTNPELFKILVNSKILFLLKNYAPFRAYMMIEIIRLNLAIRFAIFWFATAVAGIASQSSVRGRLLRRLSAIRAGLLLSTRGVW